MQLDQEFKQNHTEKVKLNTTGHVNNNQVNKSILSSNVKDFKKFENENGSIKEETIEEDDEELTNTHSRLKKQITSPPMINSVRN